MSGKITTRRQEWEEQFHKTLRNYPSRDPQLTLTPSEHTTFLESIYDPTTQRAVLTIELSYLGATRNFTAEGKCPINCYEPVINVAAKTISIELNLNAGNLPTGDITETITVTLDGNADYDSATATFTWNPGLDNANNYDSF